jgi:ankyrin repeat protein
VLLLIIGAVGFQQVSKEPGASTDRNLVLAAKANDLAGIKSALAAGANVNARLGQSQWDQWTGSPEPNLGYTALHYAAEWTNVPAERLLLEHKADPNAASLEGRTPIMIATGHLGLEFIKILLKAGANPALKDHWNHAALDHLPRMASADKMAPVRELLGGKPPRRAIRNGKIPGRANRKPAAK